ncbi:hypothetical protein SLEP1_g12128 [Rubroshorea leprosula]|nr:hypothetical protein SLEP1_g12128 [Rubroshorea leprosula]
MEDRNDLSKVDDDSVTTFLEGTLDKVKERTTFSRCRWEKKLLSHEFQLPSS